MTPAATPGTARSGVPARVETLRRRADFLAAARAHRQARPGFALQARERRAAEGATAGPRVGFTCSKKVGRAVVRNRAKRRLREAARRVLPRIGRPGWDYVLIGRPGATAARSFATLCRELEDAVEAIHRKRRG